MQTSLTDVLYPGLTGPLTLALLEIYVVRNLIEGGVL